MSRRKLTGSLCFLIADLDAERQNIRSNLIDRALDILNEHHDVSFELSDLSVHRPQSFCQLSGSLPSAGTLRIERGSLQCRDGRKHSEPVNFRRDIGETLVQSLVSLQMEDFQTAGKKILFGLLGCWELDKSKEGREAIFELFKSGAVHVTITFPWVGHVLLILEKLLSDDCRPPEVAWPLPSLDDGSSRRAGSLPVGLGSSRLGRGQATSGGRQSSDNLSRFYPEWARMTHWRSAFAVSLSFSLASVALPPIAGGVGIIKTWQGPGDLRRPTIIRQQLLKNKQDMSYS
jgi:hypothetical protein